MRALKFFLTLTLFLLASCTPVKTPSLQQGVDNAFATMEAQMGQSYLVERISCILQESKGFVVCNGHVANSDATVKQFLVYCSPFEKQVCKIEILAPKGPKAAQRRGGPDILQVTWKI